MQTIDIPILTLSLLPVGLVLFIQYRWSVNYKEGLYAVLRMIIQLALVGYVLVFVFSSSKIWVILFILLTMILTSAWIALRTIKGKRRKLYSLAVVSIGIGGGSVLIIITQVVLAITPWHNAQLMIPLAGMIFAYSMNAISLAADRYFDSTNIRLHHKTRRKLAYTAGMIPVTNSFFAVGLVLLPGIMTGQILSGVDPLIAVRYQIMVMAMVFASGGLSSALFLAFIGNDDRKIDSLVQ